MCIVYMDGRAHGDVQGGHVVLEHRPDLLARAEPRICAFDIETTKLPLQFPNAEYDQVGCTARPMHSCGNGTDVQDSVTN